MPSNSAGLQIFPYLPRSSVSKKCVGVSTSGEEGSAYVAIDNSEGLLPDVLPIDIFFCLQRAAIRHTNIHIHHHHTPIHSIIKRTGTAV